MVRSYCSGNLLGSPPDQKPGMPGLQVEEQFFDPNAILIQVSNPHLLKSSGGNQSKTSPRMPAHWDKLVKPRRILPRETILRLIEGLREKLG